MGLQIWLPLIDNTLNNQGLNPMTFSYINNSSKLVFNTEGKIGGCWERTTPNTADAIRSSTTLNLSGDFTMACWAYVTTAGNQTSANGLITNHNHNTNSGAGITVKYISATEARICCNTGNGSSRTYDAYYGTTNIYGAWHHLCLTFKKSTNNLQLWVDGVVERSITYAQVGGDNLFNIFDWSTGYTSNTPYRPMAKLNDVRVYDHCLSTKEVKELAKGLILHYKLDGRYLSDTENAGLEIDCSGYGHHGTSSLVSTAGTSAIYDNAVTFPANASQYVQNNYLRLNENITFSVWVNFRALTPGFLIDARKAEKGIQPLYFNPDYGIQIFSNVSASGSGAYVSFSPTTGRWYHLACVLTATGSKLYVNGQEVGSTSAGGGPLNSIISVGTRHTVSTPANVFMNDLRVYATALSATAVKELYGMRTSIANTGTVLSYEFNETNTESNLNITKTGILNSSDINEISGTTVSLLNDKLLKASYIYEI